jgi:hypothetical protein
MYLPFERSARQLLMGRHLTMGAPCTAGWGISIAAALALTPMTAQAGGALDRFERSHRPAPSPSRDRDDDDNDSSSSSNDSSDDSSDWSSDDDDDGSSSGGGTTDMRLALIMPCLLPPFAFACFHPSHRLSTKPYHPRGLYVEPNEPRPEAAPAVTSDVTYGDVDRRRVRYFELQASGFRAMNQSWIMGHELAGTFWAGMVLVHGSWERLYEQVEETAAHDQLDIFTGHLGSNILGPFVESAELYGWFGALVLHGEAWTPAFNAGAELRFYPVEPLAAYSSAMFSVFEVGPVLLDARWQLGVALDRFEVRAGPRWLYQGDAQGFWGPAASLAVRF